MTYLADLSTYNYGPFRKEHPDPKLLAIGWLDRSVPYNQGCVHRDVVRRLLNLAAKPVNLTRGFHVCQYCDRSGTDQNGERGARGNGEIRVAGANGKVYASPVLICHYIEEHSYRPPDEFLEAVAVLPDPPKKFAVIVALEREIHPLVKSWPSTTAQHGARSFTFYESDYATVVCAGIGAEFAHSAAEAVIARDSPEILISAGMAGSLVSDLRVGTTIFPATVIDSQDGSRHQTSIVNSPVGNTAVGRTILITYPEVATSAQKQHLAKSYGAHAVDMEAAAVARAAQSHNLPFIVVKAISDDLNFELPGVSRFVRSGHFDTPRFLLHVAIRPWLWLRVIRLTRDTKIASENLCAWLRESALTNTIAPGTRTSTGGDACRS